MLQGGVTDIPHVNFTDHWIRKKPAPLPGDNADMNNQNHETVSLHDFYGDSADNGAGNLGAAYILYCETGDKNPLYLNKAISILKEAKQNPLHNIEIDYYLGLGYLFLNRFYDAENSLKDYTSKFPQDLKGHLRLAETLVKEAKYPDAINEYLSITSYASENPVVFNYLGNAYAQSGKSNEAIAAYFASINLYPLEPTVYNNLANFYNKIKNVDSCIVYYEMALHYNPMITLASFNLGSVYLAAGKDDDAEKCFNRVLQLEPGNGSAYGNLSIIYQRKKDYDKAIIYVKKMLELNPNDPNGQKLLKTLEKQAGK
jgi:tetratricopeptide (TPR) repeat protein